MTGERSIKKNAVLLAAVQGFDYLVPIMAIPLLLRTLGAENYGKIVFVQVICAYLVALIDYGFSWTGVRKVAVNRSNESYIINVFWAVQAARGIMLVISIIVLGLLMTVFPQFERYSQLSYVAAFSILGSAIYPFWYLQGLEKLKEAVVVMLIVRICMLAGLFLTVSTENDLVLAAAFQMGGPLIGGGIFWGLLIKTGYIKWRRPSFSSIKGEFVDGWSAFFAAAGSMAYRSTNSVVLGLVSGPASVAYYSLAEKLVRAAQELCRPLTQASYARVSRLAIHDLSGSYKLIRLLLVVIFSFGIIMAGILFIFSAKIINFIAGDGFELAAVLLQYMALIPLIGGLNSVLGVQTMHPFGHASAFSKMVLFVGVFNLLIIVPLILKFSTMGAAIGYLTSEVLLLLLLVYFHRKKKFILWLEGR